LAGEKGLQNLMNGEGSQSDRDSTVEIDDNVVRLTDWLGPREELIPFGPGAEAEEAARASHASETGPVPTAQDFWSESSAAVQDALTAPHGNQDPLAALPRSEQHGPLPRSHARRGRASAAAIWERRRALLRSRPAATGAARTLPRRSFVGVLCLLLAATLVFVLSSGVLTPGAVRRGALARTDPASASSTSASAAVSRHAAALAIASHPLRIRPVRRAARRSGSRHPSSVRQARIHTGQTHHRAAPASVADAQPVGYTTPAPATASSPAAAPSSYSQTTQTAATSTSGSPAVTDSQKASSAQPALGANGSLGPGSSPDG
jgi:hypothetical protein